MILCSCTVITDRQLREAVDAILAEDEWAVITPGRLFHRLGRRMKCARCATLVDLKIVEALQAHGRTMPKTRKDEEPEP